MTLAEPTADEVDPALVAGPLPTALVVSTTAGDGVDVIHLVGEFDVATTAQVRSAVTERVVDHGRVHLVIDLTHLTFLDSCGLGALVRAQRMCRGLRGSLVLVCPEGPALRVIRLTGLERAFRIHESLDTVDLDPVDLDRDRY